jgi:hypothetical protein
MTFEDLLKLLPDCRGIETLPLVTTSSGQFVYLSTGLPEFVGPDLARSSALKTPPKHPKLLIISAAGAVGKSTLGRQIAFRKGVPIWDLADAPAVGGGSLTGQLATSFGFLKSAEIQERLSSGRQFFVIDALDEARVKVNEAGYEAFIRNVAEIAKAAQSFGLVLLARTQTAETTWLLLTDAGVEVDLLTIQPFTRDQAERYIDARISAINHASASRIQTHRESYLTAKKLIFDQLERAVGGHPVEEATREFVGYAPVLETIAVLLEKEGNFHEFIENLTDSEQTGRHQPLSVLEHVIRRLLEREQKQKLQNAIKPALAEAAAEAGWSEWENLYGHDEQCGRLLSLVLNQKLNTAPPLPPSVRSKYEEQLLTWLPEHPFLKNGREPANKVFESYLFAVALREYLTTPSIYVEALVSSAEYKPSRLLADFYLLLAHNAGSTALPEKQIGLLYESLLAGESDAMKLHLSVDAGCPDDETEEGDSPGGEFQLIYRRARESDVQLVTHEFTIVERTGILSFFRQLKDAQISSSRKVLLGGSTDEFELGPAVDIECAELELAASGLVVRAAPGADREEDQVLLDARKFTTRISRRPIVRGRFIARWPGSNAYPWTDFSTGESLPIEDQRGLHSVYIRFCRIVTTLRSHSKGSLARYRGKIEHRRVLKNEMGKALLKQLLDDGILVLEGDFYHWVPERAAALLRISWHRMRNRDVTPEMKNYFSKFIAVNARFF